MIWYCNIQGLNKESNGKRNKSDCIVRNPPVSTILCYRECSNSNLFKVPCSCWDGIGQWDGYRYCLCTVTSSGKKQLQIHRDELVKEHIINRESRAASDSKKWQRRRARRAEVRRTTRSAALLFSCLVHCGYRPTLTYCIDDPLHTTERVLRTVVDFICFCMSMRCY